MSERKQNEDEAALRARLERLDRALRARDEREAAEKDAESPRGAGFGRAISAGLNVFAEFVSAVVVGALIGWQGDAWLGTRPWLLVLFLGLGTAAGFWNIYRMAARKGSSREENS
ncbi:AtpZ/AtpI family protein [Methylocystis heyeri]|uniref:ATP synthase protein I n=1 Tax=Methylocystis heyeri TaxID=391905 RepID=A0A6B8KKN4_9HYPH|nr:AtpZ/AtpI family protein [Methylocystis heyeri]QGM47701.1 ATP F0F1 synthase subunit I [Methylocystis heyeri]